MTKIAILGAGGMLGRDVATVLSGFTPSSFTRAEVDITDEVSVASALSGFDVVINCAAYTQVDQAETEREKAHLVNAVCPRTIARVAARTGTKLIHMSTDYVFDGTAHVPYPEDAPTNPLSVYGTSKRDGELAVWEEHPEGATIVRTSWLYGEHGSSFPTTILQAGLTRETLDVVDDQQGQPTWTLDVARQLHALIDAGIPSGIFHATSSGATSWFDFAQSLFRRAGWDESRIRRASSSDFPRPATRPSFSVLSHDKWVSHGMIGLRKWDAALDEAWESFLCSLAVPRD